MATASESLKRIESDIQTWKKRLSEVEASLPGVEEGARQLREERDGLLLDGVAGKNAKAQKALDVLRPKLYASEQEREELRLVCTKTRDKLADLEKAKSLVARRACEEQRADVSHQQRQLGKEIDALLEQVVAKSGEWLRMGLDVYQLTSDLGRAPGRSPKQTLWNCVCTHFRPLLPYHVERPALNAKFGECSGQFAAKVTAVAEEENTNESSTQS